MPVSSELLNMLLMLHLDAGGGGIFREVVRPRRRHIERGEFVGGVRPSGRSERYTKMVAVYVMPRRQLF